jgi:hypothetical protein
MTFTDLKCNDLIALLRKTKCHKSKNKSTEGKIFVHQKKASSTNALITVSMDKRADMNNNRQLHWNTKNGKCDENLVRIITL